MHINIKKRAIALIKDNINLFKLNLTGYTVLTEAGTGYYLLTPLIPLLAGASKVIVWVKDTRYGSADSIAEQLVRLLNDIDVHGRIEIRKNERNVSDVGSADIITNSGNIRPLDKDLLKFTKKNCVIPLMYEAWEVRKTDVDIDYCKDCGIPVAGTWENHPDIKVFDYSAVLAIKMAFEAGFPVFKNKIIVWSDDHFGETAVRGFKSVGAREVISTTDIDVFYNELSDTDFIFICSYHETRPYFGSQGIFTSEKITELNPNITFVHLYGNVSETYCLENGINIYPVRSGKEMLMTFTLAHVGIEPLIKLQVAGFKVAQEMKEDKNETGLLQSIINKV